MKTQLQFSAHEVLGSLSSALTGLGIFVLVVTMGVMFLPYWALTVFSS